MIANASRNTPTLEPDCALPDGVRACTTLRLGGVSDAPFQSLNLGLHVGDSADAVRQNRAQLETSLRLPSSPVWLNQTHGINVCVSGRPDTSESFDASWTDQQSRVLAVLTADCLPVVFASQNGQEIAVAHAGWRGLAAGVLQNTIKQFTVPPQQLMAWMGPAIGPTCFEVGSDVLECFQAQLGNNRVVNAAFVAAKSDAQNDIQGDAKWLANLYQLATLVLNEAGVSSVHGGGLCTYIDADQFFSFRRDGARSGRMATLIWRD